MHPSRAAYRVLCCLVVASLLLSLNPPSTFAQPSMEPVQAQPNYSTLALVPPENAAPQPTFQSPLPEPAAPASPRWIRLRPPPLR